MFAHFTKYYFNIYDRFGYTMQMHRVDGPSLIDRHKAKRWHKVGWLYRTDGPAVRLQNGQPMWSFVEDELTAWALKNSIDPYDMSEGEHLMLLTELNTITI